MLCKIGEYIFIRSICGPPSQTLEKIALLIQKSSRKKERVIIEIGNLPRTFRGLLRERMRRVSSYILGVFEEGMNLHRQTLIG